jgi:hypothetical protein
MAEKTCCKTCQKKEGCRRGICLFPMGYDDLCESCFPCEAYEEVPVPVSSKPRIVAV